MSDTLDIESDTQGEYEGNLSPPCEFRAIPYHFRFTFSGQDKELKCLEDKQFIARCKTIHKRLIEKMTDLGYFDKEQVTSGFEVRNKKGENCKAHIHICFKSTHVKQSIDRTIKRYLTDTYDQEVVGNQCKMFKEWTNLRCDSSFWRYPLKQKLNINVCNGFPITQLQHWHQVAHECYLKTVEVNQAKLDKSDNSDTLFERVYNQILKQDIKEQSEVARTFINYYLNENKPLNMQTIRGYTLTTSVKLGILPIETLIQQCL